MRNLVGTRLELARRFARPDHSLPVARCKMLFGPTTLCGEMQRGVAASLGGEWAAAGNLF